MAKERIGFIGLGIMGKPMARNLLKAGYALVVHSRSRPPVDEMVAAGAADGKSPRGVAQQSDIIITMLPHSPAVRQALLGGVAQSRILDVHGQRMLERNFKPGFRVRLHQKDLNIALSTGKSLGVPLPATAVVQEALTALRGLERSDWDHSALVTLIEELAKVEVKPGK